MTRAPKCLSKFSIKFTHIHVITIYIVSLIFAHGEVNTILCERNINFVSFYNFLIVFCFDW
jgi:hypothetical protein